MSSSIRRLTVEVTRPKRIFFDKTLNGLGFCFFTFALTGSYSSYLKYASFKDPEPPTSEYEEPADLLTGGRQSWTNYLNDKLNKKSTWLVFTIVSATALVLLLLILIFLRKRIRLSIALIVEGSR